MLLGVPVASPSKMVRLCPHWGWGTGVEQLCDTVLPPTPASLQGPSMPRVRRQETLPCGSKDCGLWESVEVGVSTGDPPSSGVLFSLAEGHRGMSVDRGQSRRGGGQTAVHAEKGLQKRGGRQAYDAQCFFVKGKSAVATAPCHGNGLTAGTHLSPL